MDKLIARSDMVVSYVGPVEWEVRARGWFSRLLLALGIFRYEIHICVKS